MSLEKIKFGTDGWRAIIAKEFTVENVARVTDATAIWLKKNYERTLLLLLDTIAVLQVNYLQIQLQSINCTWGKSISIKRFCFYSNDFNGSCRIQNKFGYYYYSKS
jgi:hypothetical protein